MSRHTPNKNNCANAQLEKETSPLVFIDKGWYMNDCRNDFLKRSLF